jgi:hypothetical protein
VGQYFLEGCVVYIDDTLIYADTPEEFVDKVDKVLERMAAANIRLKPSKCEFGVSEVTFLGHVFNAEGFRLSEARKAGIVNVPTPRSVSHVRSFVGMVQFFHSFIPHLSTLLAPLTSLTKKSMGPFIWTPEAEEAFKVLKEAIMNASALSWQTESDPLVLYTDASTVGMGAVLVQEQGGQEVPLVFLSKKFSDAASRWSTIEQECFGLVYSIQQLKQYLLGRHFFIKTDHKNLIFLSSCQVPKITRWRIQLLEYDFTVLHIPGVSNVVADALSRSFLNVVRGAGEQELSESEQIDVIRSVHNEIVGHHGVERTMDILKAEGIHWKGINGQVEHFIKECLICQKIKPHRHKALATWHYHLHGNHPMEELSVDSIGPLPEDSQGNKHILVIIDNFSKFTSVYPTEGTTAVEYADALIKHIGMFGLMKTIRSDGGPQFTADIVKDLHRMIGIEHIVVAPYHPEANGLVERKNAEIMKHLRALILTKRMEEHWSRYLPLVQRIINYTKDGSLGVAPAKILFGDMLPVDMAMDVLVSGDEVPVNKYLVELKRVQAELIARSQDHLSKEAKIREGRVPSVDPNPQNSFDIGEYVLMSYPSRPPTKLNSMYRGPLVIMEKSRNDLFKVLDLITNKSYPVHISRLRKLKVPIGVTRTQLRDLALMDHGEFIVEKILDHRGDHKKKSTLEFKVRWLGFEPEDDTWEPYANLRNNVALDVYSKEHVELGLG